jgi:energy-coupling factor transport system permease protein
MHVSKDSPLNNLHPLPKLILLLTLNFIALLMESPVPFVILILGLIVTFKITRIPFLHKSKFVIVVLIASQAVLISYLLWSSIPGEIIYVQHSWGSYISEMTLLYAATMIMRYTTMLLGSTLVLSATSDRDITYGLVSLRIPYHVSFVLTLSFRSMTQFIEDFTKIKDAMILRGTDFEKDSIINRARKHVNIFLSLLMITLRRVMESSYAVEAKGFSTKRTYLHFYPLKIIDIFIVTLLISWLILTYIFRQWVGIFAFPGWPWI